MPLVKKVVVYFSPCFGYDSARMKRELMTKAELMDYLRISKRTLDKLMKTDDLPYIKLARRVLFKREDVDAFLETKRIVVK